MAASAYLLLPAPSKPEAEPSAPTASSALTASSEVHFCVFSAEGACAETPSPANRPCRTPNPSPASRRSPTPPP